MSKSKQGGAREGAGAPKKSDTAKLRAVRLNDADWTKFRSMGGVPWLRSLIRSNEHIALVRHDECVIFAQKKDTFNGMNGKELLAYAIENGYSITVDEFPYALIPYRFISANEMVHCEVHEAEAVQIRDYFDDIYFVMI